MFSRSIVTLTVLAIGSTGIGVAKSPNLSGTVVDEVGAVIARAFVLVHPDSAGIISGDSRKNLELSSDTTGRFEVDAEPGFYDVCVMSSAFVSQCQKVHVVAGRTRQLKFKLETSPEVIRELD